MNEDGGEKSQEKSITSALANLVREIGETVAEEYYQTFIDFANRLGISERQGIVPMEIWKGLAQALADCSGYTIVLQVDIIVPTTASPETWISVGKEDSLIVEPTIFVKTKRDGEV